MKHGLLFALAACLSLGLHAASIDWTTEGWGTVGNDGHGIQMSPSFGFNGNNYATFVLEGTLKQTGGYKWVTEIWGQNAGGGMQNYLAFGIDGNGNWGVRDNQGWNNVTTTVHNTVAATAGEYLIGISMKTENGTTTIDISVNGTAIVTFTGTLTGTTGIVQLKWADAYVDPDRAGFTVGATADNALTVEQIAQLPEPGALALLALGLAGLALRRRAA